MRTRAERRANRERMIDKAKQVLRIQNWKYDYPNRMPGKLADNLAKCSCPSCGNPRRYDLKQPYTSQEMRMLCEPLHA